MPRKPKNITPEQRAEIARRNGAKSRGPVTAEGKARSSRNATIHGAYARRNEPLDLDNPEVFRDLVGKYLPCFTPNTADEARLVVRVALLQSQILKTQEAELRAICAEMARQRSALQGELGPKFTENVLEAVAFHTLAARHGIVSRLSAAEERLSIEKRATLKLLRTLQRNPGTQVPPPGVSLTGRRTDPVYRAAAAACVEPSSGNPFSFELNPSGSTPAAPPARPVPSQNLDQTNPVHAAPLPVSRTPAPLPTSQKLDQTNPLHRSAGKSGATANALPASKYQPGSAHPSEPHMSPSLTVYGHGPTIELVHVCRERGSVS